MGKAHGPVAQEDVLGCGIACVAFVTGVSYGTAKGRYFYQRKARACGYLCRDLVRALSTVGRSYDYKYLKSSSGLKDGTIVFIKRSRQYPAGHYLLKTKRGWMDPWMNFDAEIPEIKKARAGFRRRLPGRPIYAVFPK
jgi:hypothetical protein